MIGCIFNRLTVMEFTGKDKYGAKLVKCWCVCGGTTITSLSRIKRGHTKSCGCLVSEHVNKIRKPAPKTHGLSKTRFYKLWIAMRQRCNIVTNSNYPDYGARGIKVCSEWDDFEKFKEDMYPSYKRHYDKFGKENTTIERISLHEGYNPDNCKWATRREQSYNRRSTRLISYKGEELPITPMAKKHKIDVGTLRHRLNKGMSTKEAIETPIKRGVMIK
jgi:hypothetical protein